VPFGHYVMRSVAELTVLLTIRPLAASFASVQPATERKYSLLLVGFALLPWFFHFWWCNE
jgi:hypothetical protein